MKISPVMVISPKTGIFIGFLLLAIGILITCFKADALILGLRSSNWPQATALLKEAKYWTTSSTTTKGQTSITYHGEHLYTFQVGGRTHQGSDFNVAGHMHTGIKRLADQMHSNFLEGAEVPVFYDPAEPARCVLKKGIAEDTQVALAFSAFFMAIGAIVLRYQIKRLRNAGLDPSRPASSS